MTAAVVLLLIAASAGAQTPAWLTYDASAERDVPATDCRPLNRIPHAKLVGTIGRTRILDSVEFEGDVLPSLEETWEKQLEPVSWTKRIFVERSWKSFCEVYRLSTDTREADFSGSTIVAAGGKKIVASIIRMTGSCAPAAQAYYILANGVPRRLKTDELVSAALDKVGGHPASCAGFSIEKLCYSQVLKPYGSSVLFRFAFSGNDLVLQDSKCSPDSVDLIFDCYYRREDYR